MSHCTFLFFSALFLFFSSTDAAVDTCVWGLPTKGATITTSTGTAGVAVMPAGAAAVLKLTCTNSDGTTPSITTTTAAPSTGWTFACTGSVCTLTAPTTLTVSTTAVALGTITIADAVATHTVPTPALTFTVAGTLTCTSTFAKAGGSMTWVTGGDIAGANVVCAYSNTDVATTRNVAFTVSTAISTLGGAAGATTANTGTYAITKTTTTAAAAQSYTFTATDATTGAVGTFTATLGVTGVVPPTGACAWTNLKTGAVLGSSVTFTKSAAIPTYILTCSTPTTTTLVVECVTADTLPAGLDLAGDANFCTLSGTPTTAAAAVSITVSPQQTSGTSIAAGNVVTSMTIGLIFSTTNFIAADATLTYAVGTTTLPQISGVAPTIATTAGTTPISYAVTSVGGVASSTLPSGLSLSSAGVLSASSALTSAASTTIVVTATDSAGTPLTGQLSFNVQVSSLSLSCSQKDFVEPGGTIRYPVGLTTLPGTPTIKCTGTSNTVSYTVTSVGGVTSSTLPSTFALDASTGVLSASAALTAASVTSIVVTGTDTTTGATGTFSFSLGAVVPTLTCTSNFVQTAGTVAWVVGAIPGSPTVSCSTTGFVTGTITVAVIPALYALGPTVALSSSGVISGTGVAIASALYTIYATDSLTGALGVFTVNLAVVTPAVPPTGACSWVPQAAGAAALGATVALPAGVPVYNFLSCVTPSTTTALTGCQVSSGTLPAGLSLSAANGACVLSGTPTNANTTSSSVVVQPSTASPVSYISAAATTIGITVTLGCQSNFAQNNQANSILYPLSTTVPGAPTVTCIGGTASTTWYATTPTPFVGGLTIGYLTGLISGTVASTAASSSITFTATDNTTSATGTFVVTLGTSAVASATGCAYAFPAPSAYSVGSAIAANTYSCSAGSAITSCASSPTLPAGLTLGAGCNIYGTPTAPAGLTAYVVTATNANSTVTSVVSFQVNGNIVPSSCSYSFSSATYFTNIALSSAPITCAVGNAITGCSVVPDLPAGLSLSQACTISGTPTTATPTKAYRITPNSTAGVGPGAVVVISVIQDSVPNVCSYSPASPSYYVNVPIGTTANGNTNSISCPVSSPITACTISPTLPAGLSFSATTCQISGTPTAVASTAIYTVTPTNVVGAAANPTIFNLTVIPDIAPSNCTWSTPSPSPYTTSTVTSITPLVLSCSSIGSPLTTCSGSLGGLTASLSAAGVCSITGIPSSATAPTVFPIAVGNNAGSGNTTALTIQINDAPPSSCVYKVPTPTYYFTSGGTTPAITKNTVTCSVGSAPTLYTLTQSGAAVTSGINGLQFSTTDGSISGSPTSVLSSANVFSVNITNANGTGTVPITVTIVLDVAPTGCAYAQSPVGLYIPGAGLATVSDALTCSTGSAIQSCAITPPLPAGLSLSTTCTVSGTATALTANTQTFAVTPTNGFGAATSATTLPLTVSASTIPSGCSYSQPSASYFLGSTVAKNNVLTCSGPPVTSCTIAPSLPTGLTFVSVPTANGTATLAPCTIYGRPTAIASLINYTITPNNVVGPSATSVTLPLAVTYLSPPPAYPPAYGTYPPPAYPSPFPPAPPAQPLPNNDTAVTQNQTARPNGSNVTAIPQTTTLTVTAAACNNIKSYPAPFLVAFQIATAAAWNKANPTLAILPGDVVYTNGYIPTTSCATSTGHKRSLRQTTSTVNIVDQIWTPPGTTAAQALAATAGFLAAAQQQYVSSQFASTYGVLAATTSASAPITVTYVAPSPPSSSSSSSSNTLAIGLGVGLGVGGAVIIGGIVAFVVLRRKDDQTVAPK